MSVHSSCVNVTSLCVRIQHLMNINHGGFPSLGMQLTMSWICMRWSCSLLVDWVSHESHGDSCRGLWCSGLYIATCLSQQALSIPSCIRSALTRWKLSLFSSFVLILELDADLDWCLNQISVIFLLENGHLHCLYQRIPASLWITYYNSNPANMMQYIHQVSMVS